MEGEAAVGGAHIHSGGLVVAVGSPLVVFQREPGTLIPDAARNQEAMCRKQEKLFLWLTFTPHWRNKEKLPSVLRWRRGLPARRRGLSRGLLWGRGRGIKRASMSAIDNFFCKYYTGFSEYALANGASVVNAFSRFCALVLCCSGLMMFTGVDVFAAQAAASGNKAEASASRETPKKRNTPRKAAEGEKKPAGKKSDRKREAAPQRFKSAILYNQYANKTVLTKSVGQRIPPASLTKILAMYVALDMMKAKRVTLQTLVPVSARAAAARGSRMGLQAGEKVPLVDLFRGMAVASGNDATVAVAEFFGGTEKQFVQAMNKKARQIGMKNSVFKNCNGLPAKGQLTTAADMLVLARSYLENHPQSLDTYHNLRYFAFKRHGVVTNANPVLGHVPGADGLKTGYVDASGYNVIMTAKRGNVRLIGVLLGCPSGSVRAEEASALLEAGFGPLAAQPEPTTAAPENPGKKPGKNQKEVASATAPAQKQGGKAPAAPAQTTPAKTALSKTALEKKIASAKKAPGKNMPPPAQRKVSAVNDARP